MQRVGFLLNFNKFVSFLFVIVLPSSLFWPLSEPVEVGILPIYGSFGLYLTDIAAILFIFSSGFSHRQAQSKFRVVFSARAVPFLPLLIIAVLGITTAPWGLSPKLALFTSARWFLASGVFIAWQENDCSKEKLIKAFLIGLSFQAIIGILQVANQGPLGLPGELALSIGRPRAAVLWLQNKAWLRAYGFTFHPNVLGGYLTVGLIIGLRHINCWAGRIGWWLMLAGLLFTFSRSAWLAAAVVIIPLVAWLYIQRVHYRKQIIVTVGTAIGALLAGSVVYIKPILSRLNVFSSSAEYTSISARGELMTLAMESISHNWVTGIGAGNFPLLALRSNVHDAAHSVHNVALMLGAEIGVIGIILWYWLWVGPVLNVRKGLRTVKPDVLILVGAWFAVGLIGLWDSYPWSLETGRLLSVTLLAWLFSEVTVN